MPSRDSNAGALVCLPHGAGEGREARASTEGLPTDLAGCGRAERADAMTESMDGEPTASDRPAGGGEGAVAVRSHAARMQGAVSRGDASDSRSHHGLQRRHSDVSGEFAREGSSPDDQPGPSTARTGAPYNPLSRSVSARVFLPRVLQSPRIRIVGLSSGPPFRSGDAAGLQGEEGTLSPAPSPSHAAPALAEFPSATAVALRQAVANSGRFMGALSAPTTPQARRRRGPSSPWEGMHLAAPLKTVREGQIVSPDSTTHFHAGGPAAASAPSAVGPASRPLAPPPARAASAPSPGLSAAAGTDEAGDRVTGRPAPPLAASGAPHTAQPIALETEGAASSAAGPDPPSAAPAPLHSSHSRRSRLALTSARSEDDEGDADAVLPSHSRHLFVIGESGRPIYTRWGSLGSVANYMGALIGLVGFAEIALGETVHTMHGGDCVAVIRRRGPLVLCGVSKIDPEATVAALIDMAGTVLEMALTKRTLAYMAQDPTFDVSPFLSDLSGVLGALVDGLDSHWGLLLGAVHPLPLEPPVRVALAAAMQAAVARHDPARRIAWAALHAGPALVASWGGAPWARAVHPHDMTALQHWVLSHRNLRATSCIFPVSLPATPAAPDVLQCYVQFLDPTPAVDVWIVVLCAAVDDAPTCAAVATSIVGQLHFGTIRSVPGHAPSWRVSSAGSAHASAPALLEHIARSVHLATPRGPVASMPSVPRSLDRISGSSHRNPPTVSPGSSYPSFSQRPTGEEGAPMDALARPSPPVLGAMSAPQAGGYLDALDFGTPGAQASSPIGRRSTDASLTEEGASGRKVRAGAAYALSQMLSAGREGPSSLPAGDLGSLGRAGPSSSPVEGSRGVVLTGRVVAVSPRSGVSRSTDGVPWSVSYPARAPDDAGSDGTRGDLVQPWWQTGRPLGCVPLYALPGAVTGAVALDAGPSAATPAPGADESPSVWQLGSTGLGAPARSREWKPALLWHFCYVSGGQMCASTAASPLDGPAECLAIMQAYKRLWSDLRCASGGPWRDEERVVRVPNATFVGVTESSHGQHCLMCVVDPLADESTALSLAHKCLAWVKDHSSHLLLSSF